jgi:hypothetical protein
LRQSSCAAGRDDSSAVNVTAAARLFRRILGVILCFNPSSIQSRHFKGIAIAIELFPLPDWLSIGLISDWIRGWQFH